MNKTINLFIIPALAALTVGLALHGLIPMHQAQNMDQLSGPAQYNIVFAFCGLLFGFIPAFIYGLAVNWMNANRPPAALPEFTEDTEDQPEQEIYIFTPPAASQAPQLYAGQVFTTPGANCQLRVKAIKY